MSKLIWHPQGRFGNTCVQYAFARAFAEKWMLELCIAGGEWVGEKIFDISHTHEDTHGLTIEPMNETQLQLQMPMQGYPPDFHYRGYAQHQGAMIYTKRQAQAWLKIRPELNAWFSGAYPAIGIIHCHRRVGDYIGYGYPVVSMASYVQALVQFQFSINEETYVTEEAPFLPRQFSWAPFLPDFLRLVSTPVLLRGNSTFSWIAGLLSKGIVLSPVIDGLQGGMEHHCDFVVGNHPRLANLEFTTDLYVNP